MNEPNPKEARTRLTDSQYARCLKIAIEYLKHNDSIRNREIREVAGIGYDQAIHFFSRATEEKHLLRQGASSATHYVLVPRKGAPADYVV